MFTQMTVAFRSWHELRSIIFDTFGACVFFFVFVRNNFLLDTRWQQNVLSKFQIQRAVLFIIKPPAKLATHSWEI